MAINKRLIKSNDEAAGGASFNTVVYSGNGTSSQSITGVGFQPDMVWQKHRRVGYQHNLMDSVRGANSVIFPDNTEIEDTSTTQWLLSFDSDGFTTGSNVSINGTSGGADNMVAWCWKAGGAAVATGGTNLTNRFVSANPEAGFSIMTYTGSGTDGEIEHGLNQAPELWIYKNRSLGDKPWFTVTTAIDGSLDYGFLNTTAQFNSGAAQYVTDTVIAVNADGGTQWVNGSGSNYVLYAFHSVPGFSKIGSYSGNSSSFDVNVGFEPSFLMIKSTNNSGNWLMLDNKRGSGSYLKANLSDQEFTSAAFDVPFTANGFTIPAPLFVDEQINEPGWEYIYMAFAN